MMNPGKTSILIVLGIVSALPLSLYALADGTEPQVVTTRFRIFTDFNDDRALELAAHLAQLHAFYSQFFDFDLRNQTKSAVRYFATKNTFDNYLINILGRTYPHFVFLDYDNVEQNELVLYAQDEGFGNALAHFAFIQFLENYIPQVPLWIREGYARYVQNSTYDRGQSTILFREHTAWLAPLREIILNNQLINFEQFFRMREDEVRNNQDVFYPQAWGMVSFFISYRGRGRDHIAQNITAALRADASEEENINAVMSVINTQLDFSTLEVDFREYILNKESFEDLVDAAIEHYGNDQLEEAERDMRKAIALDENSYIPRYYLGLIHYDRQQYAEADQLYIEALTRGAEAGTVYYALGLNALAEGDRNRALVYFEQARATEPSLFGKINAALRRLY